MNTIIAIDINGAFEKFTADPNTSQAELTKLACDKLGTYGEDLRNILVLSNVNPEQIKQIGPFSENH